MSVKPPSVAGRALPLAAAALLVLAGCAAPTAQHGADARRDSADPPTDRLGWESGVRWNESIAVNQSDGLDAAEREALVARTMARVERLRGLEFRDSVPVEVIDRAEYRNRSVFDGDRSAAYDEWHDQVWEAPLLVGEDRDVADEFDALYGGAVQGYYSPGNDRIVVVSDAADPRIDRATLAHELVHALQDQHFGFGRADSRDAALAGRGLTEGDARYVEIRYERRCSAASERGSETSAATGTAADSETAAADPGTATAGDTEVGSESDAGWDCVPRPSRSGGGGEPVNGGLFAYIYQPYADGPAFVHRLRERGGWAAVNAAYDDRPASTEQTIHPERYPGETPASVAVPDRSTGDWGRFDLDRESERLGETGLFAMFRHRDYAGDGYREGDLPYSSRNYSAAPADGWAGDRLVPYRRGDGPDAAFGYVWAIRFDDEREAREFRRAYRAMLELRLGARVVDRDAGVYRVPQGPFADAFRIERDGRRVVITNAPTVEALDGVRDPPE